METAFVNHGQLFIDGDWVDAKGNRRLDVIDPASEECFASLACASEEDVEVAVQSARASFESGTWSSLSGADRAAFLRAFAQKINDNLDELSRIEVADNGKPYPEALWDIEDAAACFEYYANLAEQLDNDEVSVDLSDERFSSSVVREPCGVVAAIVPWNFPLLMAVWKVAPALAAGCTVLLKPSEVTSLTALKLGDYAQEINLPSGVLNILSGDGETGKALSEHPGVDKIAFTGSVNTGRHIMRAAAQDIKNISLELGGKSPFIVFADSDIEAAVEWILFGIFWNQGQVCSATSRLLVERSLYPALMERLVEEVARIKLGSGLDDGVKLGPLVNQKQLDMVLAAIEQALHDGARLLCGGKRPSYHETGYFLEPTILSDVPLQSEAWTEEIFGPVLCVNCFESESQAIAIANDSRYGLAAAVMSKDDQRCERVARKLRAGIVWINCSQPTFVEAPWGGYKHSGIGRELSLNGLNNYLETKQITRFDGEEPWGWYINNNKQGDEQ